MTIEKEREEFEQFCIKDDEFCIHRYDGDPNYSDDYTQCAWLAWLASTNREGYKLVPLEPTKEMLNLGYRVKHDKIIDLGRVYKSMIGASE